VPLYSFRAGHQQDRYRSAAGVKRSTSGGSISAGALPPHITARQDRAQIPDGVGIVKGGNDTCSTMPSR
jgi:lysophospholipase L1-like esterase